MIINHHNHVHCPLAGGTLLSVLVSFIFNFGYLLVGYWYTASENYDICWTMPHCVLCLRLIGNNYCTYWYPVPSKEWYLVNSYVDPNTLNLDPDPVPRVMLYRYILKNVKNNFNWKFFFC